MDGAQHAEHVEQGAGRTRAAAAAVGPAVSGSKYWNGVHLSTCLRDGPSHASSLSSKTMNDDHCFEYAPLHTCSSDLSKAAAWPSSRHSSLPVTSCPSVPAFGSTSVITSRCADAVPIV